jgi:hypothetical protein
LIKKYKKKNPKVYRELRGIPLESNEEKIEFGSTKYKKLVRALRNEGGFSASMKTGKQVNLKGKYVVSVAPREPGSLGHSEAPLPKLKASHIKEIHKQIKKEKFEGNLFGGWTVRNRAVFDPSQTAKHLSKAQEIGKKYNQIAVYDSLSGNSLYLKDMPKAKKLKFEAIELATKVSLKWNEELKAIKAKMGLGPKQAIPKPDFSLVEPAGRKKLPRPEPEPKGPTYLEHAAWLRGEKEKLGLRPNQRWPKDVPFPERKLTAILDDIIAFSNFGNITTAIDKKSYGMLMNKKKNRMGIHPKPSPDSAIRQPSKKVIDTKLQDPRPKPKEGKFEPWLKEQKHKLSLHEHHGWPTYVKVPKYNPNK